MSLTELWQIRFSNPPTSKPQAGRGIRSVRNVFRGVVRWTNLQTWRSFQMFGTVFCIPRPARNPIFRLQSNCWATALSLPNITAIESETPTDLPKGIGYFTWKCRAEKMCPTYPASSVSSSPTCCFYQKRSVINGELSFELFRDSAN